MNSSALVAADLLDNRCSRGTGISSRSTESTRCCSALNALAAMHDGHVHAQILQMQGVGQGGVAAADHGDLLALEHEPVAGRAKGHALAHEFVLTRHTELLPGRARGVDDGIGHKDPVLAVRPRGSGRP